MANALASRKLRGVLKELLVAEGLAKAHATPKPAPPQMGAGQPSSLRRRRTLLLWAAFSRA